MKRLPCLTDFLRQKWRGRLLASAAMLAVCLIGSGVHAAPLVSTPAPDAEADQTLLQADHLIYDQKASTITAEGHVEVSKRKQLLRADRVVYDQKANVVKATGNVSLLQPSGDVMFVEQATLTSDLADGFVEKVGILFSDSSRLVANNAERFDGRYLIVEHGVYTACNLCEDDPRKPPIWQLRGTRITDDSESQDIIYRDAVVELDGVPVIYSPYFSHPEPSVKRREGFLMPSAGTTANLGFFARTPYYYDAAPETDLTFTPTFSVKDGAQVSTEWRQRLVHGTMKWTASFAYADLVNDSGVDKGTQFRGSLFGDTLFNLDTQWRAGTQIALTTDKTYLSRYSIAHDDVLINRAFLERFEGRDYTAANMYYFQDLRPGDQLTEPLVSPQVTYSHIGEPGKAWGGRWNFSSDMLIVSRSRDTSLAQQGADTRRLSSTIGWDREVISDTGLVSDWSWLARGDGYWTDNLANEDTGGRYGNVVRARPFAQGDLMLRYPIGRRGDGYQQLFEPIAQLSAAPNMSSHSLLPNEDSQDVSFDETNLFSKNRFSGLDRIEGGTRSTYGVRQSFVGDEGGRIDILTGQTYRLKENDQFSAVSGLREQASDYVGRIDFVPNKYVDLNYGFMLSKNDFSTENQEIRGNAGVPAFRPFVNYVSVNQTLASDNVTPLEEITGGFTSQLNKFYALTLSHRQAFKPDPGPRQSSISLRYRDECLQLGITASRDDTNRQGLSSGDSIVFHFYLRNVGGIQTDSSAAGDFDKTLMTKPASGTSSLGD